MSSSFVCDWIVTDLYVFPDLVGAIRVSLSCHLSVMWSRTRRTQTLAKRRPPTRKRARDECNNVRREDEFGRVRLELRRLRQPDEVVAEQPPVGVRFSDEAEECLQRRFRSITTGKAAAPSTEVRIEFNTR